jgi:hypothetical protein
VKTPKSHQRKLVDGSDPAYKDWLWVFTNPTNGSWWMVQIQPTKIGFGELRIPPTEVGGWFRSSLFFHTEGAWN